jgi:hypothetical protein
VVERLEQQLVGASRGRAGARSGPRTALRLAAPHNRRLGSGVAEHGPAEVGAGDRPDEALLLDDRQPSDLLRAIMPDFEGLMESGASIEDSGRNYAEGGR